MKVILSITDKQRKAMESTFRVVAPMSVDEIDRGCIRPFEFEVSRVSVSEKELGE